MYKISNVIKSFSSGVLLNLLVVGVASAVDFYQVTVNAITTRTDGDIVVVVEPAASETKFTGTAKLLLPKDQPGSNKILAVCLTSIALNVELQAATNNSLAANPVQVPLQVALKP